MRSLIISFVLLVFFSSSALAHDNYDDIYSYFKGGLHHWEAGDISEDGLKLAFGQQLTSFAGVEAHFAIGGEDKETETKLDRLFGLYGKFNLPLEYLNPYVKLGFTSASLKEADSSVSEFEMSYGVGIELNVNKNVFFDLEYMSYLDTSELELTAFTLSVGYKLR